MKFRIFLFNLGYLIITIKSYHINNLDFRAYHKAAHDSQKEEPKK